MRWEIIKQAWGMARQEFPDVECLFVDFPEKFMGFGDCSIYDLEKPEKPLGSIVYEAKCEAGKPILALRLKERTVEASLPRASAMHFKTASGISKLERRVGIDAVAIMSQYPDENVLGEQLAFLIVGHADGLVKTDGELHDGLIETWIVEHGFPRGAAEAAISQVESLGFKVAKKKRNRQFENFEKVRVTDPRMMEHNEAAKILSHKRDEHKQDWYEVIVDGSEKPIWLHEMQLSKNTVGVISDISIVDEVQGGE